MKLCMIKVVKHTTAAAKVCWHGVSRKTRYDMPQVKFSNMHLKIINTVVLKVLPQVHPSPSAKQISSNIVANRYLEKQYGVPRSRWKELQCFPIRYTREAPQVEKSIHSKNNESSIKLIL